MSEPWLTGSAVREMAKYYYPEVDHLEDFEGMGEGVATVKAARACLKAQGE